MRPAYRAAISTKGGEKLGTLCVVGRPVGMRISPGAQKTGPRLNLAGRGH